MIPEKKYFRIGEVSKILGVKPYVVRYWESEFSAVRPQRTPSDQRLYRRKDLEELLLIRDLLYNRRFTIAGAKKHLKELKNNSGETSPGAEDIMGRVRNLLVEIRHILS
ncbi:MAG: MerR family transcriptional regulator [Deltaproteobacteria bacterium]|nr:MerR family transcriptional regulator [Deltaproteobacteria bacterium]